MSLLDSIRTKLETPQAQPTTAGTGAGQTQSIRELLRAKSGKTSTPSTGPRQSALQEKVAQSATQAELQQQGLRGAMQSAQIGQREADIEQREQQQLQQAQQQRENMQAQALTQAETILSEFERGQKSLENRQDIADLEQLGFTTRLQSQQYVEELQDQGRRNRLDDKLEFQKQLAQTVFADQQDLLKDKLAFESLMNADNREFSQELANMDINYAMKIAEDAVKAANTATAIGGIGVGISGATKAADKAGSFKGIFNSTSENSPGPSGEANPTNTNTGV